MTLDLNLNGLAMNIAFTPKLLSHEIHFVHLRDVNNSYRSIHRVTLFSLTFEELTALSLFYKFERNLTAVEMKICRLYRSLERYTSLARLR